jgi:hypothetical protein
VLEASEAATGAGSAAGLPPPAAAALTSVVGPSASGTVSVTHPHLPSSLSSLQRLEALSIRSPVDQRLNTVAADAVRGWELPAELAALTGLTSLVLEAVVPPRR